jgi:hypothetical protein
MDSQVFSAGAGIEMDFSSEALVVQLDDHLLILTCSTYEWVYSFTNRSGPLALLGYCLEHGLIIINFAGLQK